MADWSTVAIAIISAGAGLSGGIIAGHYNLKALNLSHRRDDAVSIRAKVEELYAELDRIEILSNASWIRALAVINSSTAQPNEVEPIILGTVRSIVGLYFPTCQPAVDAFDERSVEIGRHLRTDVEEKKLAPVAAMFGYVTLEHQSRTRMCGEVRQLLGEQAAIIGKSVRKGP